MQELKLELKDTQWTKTNIDHDRQVVRAIVVDEQQNYYFVKVHRDDIFGALVEEISGVCQGNLSRAAFHQLNAKLLLQQHDLFAEGRL